MTAEAMVFFDPVYMVLMGVGMLLSLAASGWVKASVSKWSKVPIGRGMRGCDVAELILRHAGVQGVRIEPTEGRLSDHYDPTARCLRLSHDNYYGTSVAAAGISAHEVGHAIQHRDGYWPMSIRQQMVPVANIGTNIGVWMVMIGMMMGAAGLAKLGVILFAAFVAFTVVTLPVEIDASLRAKKALLATGVVSSREAEGVSRVLTAAAATYVAAAVTAILQLVYFAMRAGLLGGRRDD